jgi:cell division protein FtsI/penicillin-binding protein 2
MGSTKVLGLGAALLCLALASHAEARLRRTRKAMPAKRPAPSLLVAPDASPRDLEIAEACRAALDRASGSVVAMDPRNGRVIAVVNPQHGLERAYQPCSVFKIVVGLAGLSEGIITPETTYNCAKGCWMWPGHGLVDLRRSLAVSCNPYFEWVGEQLGYKTIERYAQLLGLGAPTGINFEHEAPGRLPFSVSPSEVGHLSSHAAGITTSAAQVAVLLSATINGGIVFQPQLAGPVGFVPKERWRLPEKTVYRGLADGFVSAVNEGSAAGAFDPNVLVAGKTGSCSRVGWFASYAPADRPEIAIVVFLRGGNGHRASDVAGRVYQALYKLPDSTTTRQGAVTVDGPAGARTLAR